MDSPAPPLPPPPPPELKPWGFWATVGLGLAVSVLYSVAQFVVVMVGMWVLPSTTGASGALSNPTQNGLLLSVTTCLTAPVLIGLTSLLAWLRRGPALQHYFALRWPPAAETTRAVICFLVFMAAADTVTVLLDRPVVPDFMVEAYQTAGFTPLLWFTVIVVAPVTEELFFRGFLFTGIQHSRAGPVSATVLTALLWAVIHVQYDFHGIATIFAGGLMLGWVRVRTGSLLLCMALHALMNLVATLQLLGLLHYTKG